MPTNKEEEEKVLVLDPPPKKGKGFKKFDVVKEQVSQTSVQTSVPTSGLISGQISGQNSGQGGSGTPNLQRCVTQQPVASASQTSLKRPGDNLPFQSKKSRMHIIKPDFDEAAYADILLKLNDARYLICGKDGSDNVIIKIQDCAFRKQPGDDKFVPRSVKLTPQQWIDLLNLDADVKEALEGDTHTRAHVGRNTFVTIKPEYSVVDIREFFLPADPNRQTDIEPSQFSNIVIPTKRGVMLSPSGWARLITKGAEIVKEYGEEKMPQNSGCCDTHDGQTDYLACDHCNPNGYKNWKRTV